MGRGPWQARASRWRSPSPRPLLLAAIGAVLSLSAADAASVDARKKPPGPALTTSAPAHDAALACPQGVRGDRRPVLLVCGAAQGPYSRQQMPRQGRELERLVEILEGALLRDGVRVTSPERIRDTVTGEMREVDVAIRPQEGDAVLAVCECRDRKAVADVTWVEQMVTKLRDLEGSPAMLLVSTSGFTRGARKKAESYGLDLRLVAEASVEEFSSWFRVEHAVVIEIPRTLHGCEIHLTPEDFVDFSESTKAALKEHGVRAAIFQRRELEPISADQLFEEWYRENHQQVERDAPVDGRPFCFKVSVPGDPRWRPAVETNVGLRAVAKVDLLVEVTRESRLVPVSRASRYEDETTELAQSVEFRLGEGLGTVSAHRTPGRPTRIQYRQPED